MPPPKPAALPGCSMNEGQVARDPCPVSINTLATWMHEQDHQTRHGYSCVCQLLESTADRQAWSKMVQQHGALEMQSSCLQTLLDGL